MTNIPLLWHSTEFEGRDFFIQLAQLYLYAFLLVHLVHWIFNFIVEKSQGRGMKINCLETEGLLMVVGFGVPAGLFALFIILSSIFPSHFDWIFVPVSFSWYRYIAWLGFGLGVCNVLSFAWVHYELGMSWSGTVNLKENHELKVNGPYRLARHPMYAVIMWVPLVYLLITSSWFLSLLFCIMFVYPVSRFRKEERLMLSEFGEQYATYMQNVGAFWPWPLPFDLLPPHDLSENKPLLVNENNHDNHEEV